MGYESIQKAKMFENIHLRWFIICIRISKRNKKTLFFNCKFLIEENGLISIQNAKMFENIHLRWFIIRIRIGTRKKKTPFF